MRQSLSKSVCLAQNLCLNISCNLSWTLTSSITCLINLTCICNHALILLHTGQFISSWLLIQTWTLQLLALTMFVLPDTGWVLSLTLHITGPVVLRTLDSHGDYLLSYSHGPLCHDGLTYISLQVLLLITPMLNKSTVSLASFVCAYSTLTLLVADLLIYVFDIADKKLIILTSESLLLV